MYQPKKYTCNDAVFRPFLVDTMVHVPLSTKKILDSFLVYTVKHQQKEIDWDFILGYDLPVSTFSEKSQLLLYPVITLDTVNFTECDPMLRITTLLFSESISPLSETDDVVHNVFLNTQCSIERSTVHRSIAHYWIDNCLFVCLFYCFICQSLSSHSKNFHSYNGVVAIVLWKRHHNGWRDANFDHYSALMTIEHSRSLGSEGSSGCNTYRDTGQPYINVISEDPWHSHLQSSVKQWIYH